MDANYEIVTYRPELKRQIIELQTHLWSPDLSLNASYFEWKYQQNPYLKEPLIYLAMHDGKAVGMRGFFGVQWECGVPAERFTCLYADDMVVAPEHRNRGLTAKIMTTAFEDLAAEGYDYVFNLSAGPVTLHSSLSVGWRSAGWMRPMRRRPWATVLKRAGLRRVKKSPAFPDKLVNFASKRLKRLSHSLDEDDLQQINNTLKHIPNISVEDVPRCEAMAELVARTGTSGRIRHVRDRDYFRWRFQNPLSRYRYIYLGKDRLDAYLVLQEYTSDFIHWKWNMLNVVNWEASSSAAREAVFNAALTVFAKTRDLVVWSATLPDPTIALLRKNSFRVMNPPRDLDVAHYAPAVLVRPIANFSANSQWALGGQQLLDLTAWDLQMLYSMLG